jgi:allophanate hydrolase
VAHLTVIAPGARTLVQDMGFAGARGQGVPAGGVMDRTALALVNALLGNPPGTEALEVALTAPVLRAGGGPVRIALGGTLRGVVLGADGFERPVAPWTATTLLPGDTLRLAPPDRGGTGVIGVGGGLDVPVVLGSRSTCLPAGFGGVAGRALRAGDTLTLRGGDCAPGPDLTVTAPPLPGAGPIRVVPGPQADWFVAPEIARFLAGPWVITPRLDRMGMRLDGPALRFATGKGGDIISDGIAPGAVQVPGNGLPIILLADAQTTGGYPKIATVIRADQPRLAAMMPGDTIRFVAVTAPQAEAAARAAQDALARAIASIGPRRQAAPTTAELMAANLIGGAVDMRRPDHFPGHLFPQQKE